MDRTRGSARLVFPGLAGFYERASRFSYPMVRVIAGANLIPHGGQKLWGWFGGDINRTAEGFAKLGLEPALPLAYYIGCLEFFGGILLVIGLFTRPVAVLLAGFMAVAAFYVHLPNGFFWPQGGFEYPLMWLVLAIAIFFRGGGPYSLDEKLGREF